MANENPQLVGLVWSFADLLRGNYPSSDYSRILIAFITLRRLDCLLGAEDSPFKPQASAKEITAAAVHRYLRVFPEKIGEAFQRYGFLEDVTKLQNDGLLERVVHAFTGLDLRREVVSEHDMGDLLNELVRGFAEQSADRWGEHFTPPDVARLMAGLLLTSEASAMSAPDRTRTVLDPTCGTGSLLNAVAEETKRLNPEIDLSIQGQEINSEFWALCSIWMTLSGRDPNDVKLGNAITGDRYTDMQFDYLIAHPPFGMDWRQWADVVRAEYEQSGSRGRFGAGLPRTSDSSLLFLQHALAKMKPTGSRLAFLFNAAPMCLGSAGSGESEIRRWIVENDWLEAVVALPAGLHYNTSIKTYIWTLSSRKPADRRGKVVLVDARDCVLSLRRPVGSKNRQFSAEQVEDIVRVLRDGSSEGLAPDHALHGKVQMLRNEEIGYREVLVEEPLRLRFELTDASLTRLAAHQHVVKKLGSEEVVNALRPLVDSVWEDEAQALASVKQTLVNAGVTPPSRVVLQKMLRDSVWVRDPHSAVVLQDGQPEPDPELRRSVPIPLDVNPDRYFQDRVVPDSPDAWLDRSRTKVGYAISPSLFSQPALDTRFVPLSEYASLVTTSAERDEGQNQLRYLRAEDLPTVEVAVELPLIRSSRTHSRSPTRSQRSTSPATAQWHRRS